MTDLVDPSRAELDPDQNLSDGCMSKENKHKITLYIIGFCNIVYIVDYTVISTIYTLSYLHTVC